MSRAAMVVMALLSACDWQQSALLNSVPITGTRTDDMYIYLAYDGMDPSSLQDAMARGAFQGTQWHAAKFITGFPGSSDVSWTRIMRAEKLKGYEYEYYDPTRDALINSGVLGLAGHILPNLGLGLDFEPAYLESFDYRSHGYLHNFDVYSDTWLSVNETFDDLFYQLDGRAQTDSVFIGYIMEGDVLGHTGVKEDCVQTLLRLSQRIEEFREAHPQRKLHFTLLSDHGMDFSGQPDDNFLDYGDELPKVGITPVDSLNGRTEEVYAVPVLHVRIMYYAMHTTPALVREVARRISTHKSIDFAVGRIDGAHFGLWTGGAYDGSVSYANGRYTFDGDFSRYGIRVAGASDEELFEMTKDGRYPDIMYRLRTALSASGTEYPADVMVSCKTGFASNGAVLKPHHPDGFSHSGNHGGINADGIGALITEERELPDAVRSDAFLDLFPRALQHLHERGVTVVDPDPDAVLAP